MVIVGRREKEEKTISLRKRGKENLGSKKLEQLITFLKEEAK